MRGRRNPVVPLTAAQRADADARLALLWWAVGACRDLGRGLPADEWRQTVGLAYCEAVRRHDPARGPFTSALRWAIREQVTAWRRSWLPAGFKLRARDGDPPPTVPLAAARGLAATREDD